MHTKLNAFLIFLFLLPAIAGGRERQDITTTFREFDETYASMQEDARDFDNMEDSVREALAKTRFLYRVYRKTPTAENLAAYTGAVDDYVELVRQRKEISRKIVKKGKRLHQLAGGD